MDLAQAILIFRGGIQGLSFMSLRPITKEFVLGITVVGGPKLALLI